MRMGSNAPSAAAPSGACSVIKGLSHPPAVGRARVTTRCAPGPLLPRLGHGRPPSCSCGVAVPRARPQLHTLRQRLQTHLNATAPTDVMVGTACEADELYHHAGEKSPPHRAPSDPPRRRANQRKGHGTDATDRPPIIRVIARETGEPRLWGCDHADMRPCTDLSAENVPAGRTRLYPDEWQRYRGSPSSHATVGHGGHEGARDDAGDGHREVHGHTCEGAGAALRTYLRAFRGVHKPSVPLYRATYEARVNAKRVTPDLIRRLCVGDLSMHTGYT